MNPIVDSPVRAVGLLKDPQTLLAVDYDQKTALMHAAMNGSSAVFNEVLKAIHKHFRDEGVSLFICFIQYIFFDLFISSFVALGTFSLGTSPWSQGINPSLPGARLTF